MAGGGCVAVLGLWPATSSYLLRAFALRQGSEEEAMATARRLSEFLQEQQESFLVEAAMARLPGAAVAGAPTSPPAAAEEESGTVATPRRAGGYAGSATTGSRSGVAAAARESATACGRPCCRVLRWEDLGASVGCGREFRCLRRPLVAAAG
ncbi:unnamed protein product [Urochloa humidicola]